MIVITTTKSVQVNCDTGNMGPEVKRVAPVIKDARDIEDVLNG